MNILSIIIRMDEVRERESERMMKMIALARLVDRAVNDYLWKTNVLYCSLLSG